LVGMGGDCFGTAAYPGCMRVNLLSPQAIAALSGLSPTR
jgi:hypothetical protein